MHPPSLRPFQRRFIAGALRPGVDTAALSLPRGNGKSWIAGHLVARILDPADKLFRPGTESVLCAASIEQARICYRFAREILEPAGGYRFLDSAQRIGITHTNTNTRLRVISSNGRTAMGLVNTPYAVCDEPGSWEVNGGTLMFDALMTALGKPGSPMRIIIIGTIAPADGGWWPNLIKDGTHGSTYVQALKGDPEKWDDLREIRRVNPLYGVDAKFRSKLREERDAARSDSRLKARFLSYRLNVPSGDESSMLLTTDDWSRICSREVPERDGLPIVGVDLAGGRAWSAATGIWRNGRVEALAIAPGIPEMESQEKRDRVPRGTYQRLLDRGSLRIAAGLRVQPPGDLVKAIREAWGGAEVLFCDRFRLPELLDCVGNIPVVPRVTRWSEASEDIRALRKASLDGPLSCPESSRALLQASLAAARVENDSAGSFRLVKRDVSNNTGRDDVAAALTLAAGALARAPKPRTGGLYLGPV